MSKQSLGFSQTPWVPAQLPHNRRSAITYNIRFRATRIENGGNFLINLDKNKILLIQNNIHIGYFYRSNIFY